MINYNIPLAVSRVDEAGNTTAHEVRAIVSSDEISLPLTADIEEGDVVEDRLPNGKTRRMVITQVTHLRSPFGRSTLDHITAKWKPARNVNSPSARRVAIEGMHPEISRVSGALFEDGHTTEAVFQAFREVEARVQRLGKSTDSGQALMGTVFGKSPVLDITSAAGKSADDERDGFRFLFMGSMAGVRNPRGHGSRVNDTAEEALEYLALASMLMRRLDLAEKRL